MDIELNEEELSDLLRLVEAEAPAEDIYGKILVANVVEFKDALEANAEFDVLPTIIGVIVAAVVGVGCIKLLQWILKKDMWKYFGFYCILIGFITIICKILGL